MAETTRCRVEPSPAGSLVLGQRTGDRWSPASTVPQHMKGLRVMKFPCLHIPFCCLRFSPSSSACALTHPLTSAVITQTKDSSPAPALFLSSWPCFDVLCSDQKPGDGMYNKTFLDRCGHGISVQQIFWNHATIY